MWALSIEKWQLLLCVILYRSEGEKKKESKEDTCRQVAEKRKERNMATVWTDILSDVFIANNFYEWNFIVNNIFINEFYSRRGFVSKIL